MAGFRTRSRSTEDRSNAAPLPNRLCHDPQSRAFMEERVKIRTERIYPPIPVRSFDWIAVEDAYDAGDAIGTGATEEEAIADLKEQLFV